MSHSELDSEVFLKQTAGKSYSQTVAFVAEEDGETNTESVGWTKPSKPRNMNTHLHRTAGTGHPICSSLGLYAGAP